MKKTKFQKSQKNFLKSLLIYKLVLIAMQVSISNAIDALVNLYPTTVGSLSTMNISIMLDASLGKGGIVSI
jgi:hypothetical protein